MSKTLRALTQMLQIWWNKDRIRVARSEGKLFRIRVGDRLLIDNKIFDVVGRRDSDAKEIAHVIYTLAEGDANDVWCLEYTMQCAYSTLSLKNEMRDIFNDQISVLVPIRN